MAQQQQLSQLRRSRLQQLHQKCFQSSPRPSTKQWTCSSPPSPGTKHFSGPQSPPDDPAWIVPHKPVAQETPSQ